MLTTFHSPDPALVAVFVLSFAFAAYALALVSRPVGGIR